MKHILDPARSLLSNLSEAQRSLALERFRILRPFFEEQIPLPEVAHSAGISLRTAWYWARRYQREGLVGLARKIRRDRDQRKLSPTLQQFIEGLALQKPRPSVATIHRKVAETATNRGERVPSYTVVYRLIRKLEPALLTLAHEGTKAYSESFDLIYRAEAQAPNAIWQADHTQLDIFLRDEKGKARKPWLTIVLDDYSRAAAGYFLFFNAPSAIQTALALRQAIWRKAHARWHVCGIPQVLYIDHGSDLTSRPLERVAADLKIQLLFSGTDCGRGKCERFFSTITETLLSPLPGYAPGAAKTNAVLTLPELDQELERYLIGEYLVTPHRETGQAPQARWDAGGFLPHMPDSLEKLDLLLLTVPKACRIHQGGIRFLGLRYIDPTLTAYAGEEVMLRYDPRDMAEVRVFYHERFLCRAICQELACETVTLGEIVSARNRRRRQSLGERRRLVDLLIEAKRSAPATREPETPPPVKLKRYFCDE
jgi:putative transposase